MYSRADEMLLFWSIALKVLEDTDLKHEIYLGLLDIVHSYEDLTLFIKLKQGEKKGFSNGLKQFVKSWYSKRTNDELVDIVSRKRRANGYSHLDLIRLSHIKVPEDSVLKVVFQRGSKFVQQHQQKQAQEQQAEPEKNSANNEDKSNGDEVVPGKNDKERLVTIARFKTCEDPKAAIEMINQHKLPVDLLPSHLQKSPEVLEALVPAMHYRTLLKQLWIIYDLNLLDSKNTLSKKVAFALANNKSLSAAKLHPFEIFSTWRLYEKNQRYLDSVKEEHRVKRLAKTKIVPNPGICKKLKAAFEQSFEFAPSLGQRVIVTIDNRHGLYQKSIISRHKHPHISVFEASLIIALTLLKREKDVKVLTFTETGVEPLAIQKSMTFEDAFKFCMEKKQSKTKHTLEAPVTYAKENDLKIDVFITIGDSVINMAGQGKVPTATIVNYRKAVKLNNARYVAIGLSRAKQDLKFTVDDVKILELGGFSPDTAKIIEHFCKDAFY